MSLKVLSKPKSYALPGRLPILKTFLLPIKLWNLLFYNVATPIVSLKTAKNGHYLSPTANPNTMITGCKSCLTNNCELCPLIRTTNYITSSQNNQVYPISQNTDCKTHNCMYALHCSLYTHIPTLYIGETKNACHIIFSQHKHNILLHKDSVIPNHFNQLNQTTFLCFKSQFFKASPWIPNALLFLITLKKAEERWISKFNTHSPIGLNTVAQLNVIDISLILKFSNSATCLARQVKTICKSASPHSDNFSITICFSNNRSLKKFNL